MHMNIYPPSFLFICSILLKWFLPILKVLTILYVYNFQIYILKYYFFLKYKNYSSTLILYYHLELNVPHFLKIIAPNLSVPINEAINFHS